MQRKVTFPCLWRSLEPLYEMASHIQTFIWNSAEASKLKSLVMPRGLMSKHSFTEIKNWFWLAVFTPSAKFQFWWCFVLRNTERKVSRHLGIQKWVLTNWDFMTSKMRPLLQNKLVPIHILRHCAGRLRWKKWAGLGCICCHHFRVVWRVRSTMWIQVTTLSQCHGLRIWRFNFGLAVNALIRPSGTFSHSLKSERREGLQHL